MNVLVVGSGGREHSLVWKLRQSPRVARLFCAPGNAGLEGVAERVDIGAGEIERLLQFAKDKMIGLTVVGPEAPLTEGIVDRFQAEGLRIFGPTRAAAAMEGSKVFCKEIMQKYNIPTGHFAVFTDAGRAKAHIDQVGAPVVVKADGLAAGKGVIVAKTVAEAHDAIDLILGDRAFGAAGDRVVVEEFLEGEEASFLAFSDGTTVLPLPTSQDHKAAYDNDQGPNTGGMGAYSPAPVVTDEIHRQVMAKIMLPTVAAMAAEGRPYKGVLYAGLMIKDGVAKVLEYNCRFGDPECQPLLMRLNSDLVEVMEAVIDGRLDSVRLDIDPRPTVCVVMAAGGYPGSYAKGQVIHGLDQAATEEGVVVFHAGTARKGDDIVTAGGRVLGVTAIGDDLRSAIDRAYRAVASISWKDVQYRRDIGRKALRREMPAVRVGIVMGSDSDLEVMKKAAEVLNEFGVGYEMAVNSAHRTPEAAARFAATARDRGIRVIIAGAGMAAHLAGAMAAHSTLPVIGVPIDVPPLNGLDALLATVQMPPGVPVASMGIGKAGAKNAGLFAVQILAAGDQVLADRLVAYKKEMAAQVEEKNRKLAKHGN
ncbi:MAG: phosphoribosylamine--glycine ligase [Thermodesulfobacteriota bacterium]